MDLQDEPLEPLGLHMTMGKATQATVTGAKGASGVRCYCRHRDFPSNTYCHSVGPKRSIACLSVQHEGHRG